VENTLWSKHREQSTRNQNGGNTSQTTEGASPQKRPPACLAVRVKVHEGRNALPNIIRPICKGQEEQNAEACFFNQQVLGKHSRKNSLNSPGSDLGVLEYSQEEG